MSKVNHMVWPRNSRQRHPSIWANTTATGQQTKSTIVFIKICIHLESSLGTEKYSVPKVISVTRVVWSEGPATQHCCIWIHYQKQFAKPDCLCASFLLLQCRPTHTRLRMRKYCQIGGGSYEKAHRVLEWAAGSSQVHQLHLFLQHGCRNVEMQA